MQIPRVLTLLVALIALAVTVIIGLLVTQPARALIEEAAFDQQRVTPNADGENDVITFSYVLTKNAVISLTFTDSTGQTYTFRDQQTRPPGNYSVLFSGVVHGYALPDETVVGNIEKRLLQNGTYTWLLTAVDEQGDGQEVSGTLTVEAADSQLPDLTGFTISRETFTPNQDGIADRVSIYVYVTKEADLTMYLENDAGDIFYIAERNEGRLPGEAGEHIFDYDGGIDAGLEPPEDGPYTLVVRAEDAEGQSVSHTGTLEVDDGGIPLGGIYTQTTGTTVFYDTLPYADRYFADINDLGELMPIPEGVEGIITDETVVQGDMLVFRVTISNDGDVGLRTAGPPPGTVYEQDQRASSLGFYAESGAWRVGLECDTADASYPWRWAIGAEDVLDTFEDQGETYYYLPPGRQAVVWGAVRLTNIVPSRNPQQCFIGLIHEDVAVRAPNIDPRWVEIVPGPEGDTTNTANDS